LKLAQASPNPTGTPVTTPSPSPSPTTAPIPTQRPTTAPIPTQRPTTAPIPTQRPTTAPIPTQSPVTAPIPTRSPVTSPSPSPSPTTAPSPTSSPATPTNQNLCRRVIKPAQGLVIRQEPTTKAPIVGRVAYQGRVTLTANPPTTRTDNERDWVEISSPTRGWISHSLLVETVSNLAYCR
jgi:hypothetical protein